MSCPGGPPPTVSVVVVGSVNVDFVVRLPRLPTPGVTVTGGLFERHEGGKGANQAVAAARAGASVSLVAGVGDDEFGEHALAELEREGIDTRGCLRLPGVPTGVALVVVDDAGENQIAVASGANARLDAGSVERALGAVRVGPGTVCLTGFEVPEGAVLAAARWARARHLQVIVDPAPARPLSAELFELGPVLTPNRVEARDLTGESDPGAAARALAARSGAPVIVTLSGEGALLAEGDRLERLPGSRVNVVDATGAGDAFNGVLAAELARGSSFREAARWASAAGALATTKTGAREAMPTRQQIASFLGRA